jgi:hypothetical protein
MRKDSHEFDSLFEDEKKDEKSQKIDNLFTFDDMAPHVRPDEAKPAAADKTATDAPPKKKRTSEDFEPDMDALLVTAQSPLVIEGLKYLTRRDFSSGTLPIYAEAVSGVEVFIKILERNPNNYYKLTEVINTDDDCKTIETTALRLYKMKYHYNPQSDNQILQAYEMLRNRLKIGYNKVLLSTSMIDIRKYFLLSGNLNTEKIAGLAAKNDAELKDDIAKFTRHFNVAIELMKVGDYEITRGVRGRDVNAFIIRASQLLAYYSHISGNQKLEEHYQRLHENYKKYIITR